MNSFPIDQTLPELKEAVARNSSVVLHAPPGAGKTTRVPIALLDVIPPEAGRIVMLEPRRIAAVSAARWMAQTLGQEAGETVGYSIRFDSRISKETRIEVVTEGILTRRIQSDPGLEGVAMVIFDEFHERSLHADLALALCLDVRRVLREDLKIAVMSATLDCGPVASLLGGAPVITSTGRAFPVEERYLDDKKNYRLVERAAEAVGLALNETSGDILVFLPGSGEIRSCAEALQPLLERRGEGIALHQLYGDLPFEEQERAILPSDKRKIVLATNIAETSLTIEGVHVVIDSGLARRLQYNPSTGMDRLITVPVSKASAEQRKGRAGRIGPGVCYRIYSRHTFHSMAPFAPPEMLLSDISALALELAAWGAKGPEQLGWLDPPPAAAWASARRLLASLGAIDSSGSVTPVGKAMAQLPLHPRLARLMLRAKELSCPCLGADLASLLSERDILRRKKSERAGHMTTDAGETDIAERLDVLHAWRNGQGVHDADVDQWALRGVDRTARQLIRLTGKTVTEQTATPDMISRMLLCAFPDRVAGRREDGEGRFVLANGKGVRIPATNALARSPFIIAVTLDEGKKAEGTVYNASPVTVELLRQECEASIENVRRVEWDKREAGIIATVEERLGAVLLSARPFSPSDEEAASILCEAIRSAPGLLNFSKEARQLQGRIGLMRRAFPEEPWPEVRDTVLASVPEEWLLPWLGGIRNAKGLAALDIVPALRALLSWEQLRLLDERAPLALVVPSGSRVGIDYTSGDVPLLAVKLQEMFGLANTPEIANGRIKVLIHLLSPARRPVQITQDLKGFWDNSYHLVKKELKGRYPKHPWPDDPWNAVATRKTKLRNG